MVIASQMSEKNIAVCLFWNHKDVSFMLNNSSLRPKYKKTKNSWFFLVRLEKNTPIC